jgi:hypothetical protein
VGRHFLEEGIAVVADPGDAADIEAVGIGPAAGHFAAQDERILVPLVQSRTALVMSARRAADAVEMTARMKSW